MITTTRPRHDDTLDELVRTVLDDVDAAHNPYFVALRDGSLTREDFLATQVQFYFVVTFFSRPMAAVAARIPEPELRLAILRNVWEEHGDGDLQRAHGATFLELLRRLAGVTREELDHTPLWPEARLFDTALAGAATLDEALIGVAMLGMIERMFVDISGWLAQGIVARGWLAPGEMIHYDLHEALDVRHSAEFFEVLRARWDSEPRARYYIEQGLRLGAAAFDGLYRGLYLARARRWAPVVRGHHART
jgi:pyrroloquinoline quinone (PQQ) biosynthesis protein C